MAGVPVAPQVLQTPHGTKRKAVSLNDSGDSKAPVPLLKETAPVPLPKETAPVPLPPTKAPTKAPAKAPTKEPIWLTPAVSLAEAEDTPAAKVCLP